MKIAALSLVIFTAFFNCCCRQYVESSPVAANEQPVEKPAETPPSSLKPEKYSEEINVTSQFSALENDDLPVLLEYKDYKIKRVAVKKKDEYDNPEADIYDLVISKSGKTVARFEGLYNPLGNEIGFGFYRFLKGSEKQLLLVDESNRYDREWIVSLSPRYVVIFDAEDFEVVDGHLMVIDFDNDGEKEITLAKFCFDSEFGFPMSDRPWLRVIFKYDAGKHKYLPASHIFPDYTLNGQARRIQKFSDNPPEINGSKFSKLLEIFMTYVYAGNEAEAWRFFDANFPEQLTVYGAVKAKEVTRTQIKAGLNKDPIYKFIRKDIQKRNQKSAAD
jgi:hypothetical protein